MNERDVATERSPYPLILNPRWKEELTHLIDNMEDIPNTESIENMDMLHNI